MIRGDRRRIDVVRGDGGGRDVTVSAVIRGAVCIRSDDDRGGGGGRGGRDVSVIAAIDGADRMRSDDVRGGVGGGGGRVVRGRSDDVRGGGGGGGGRVGIVSSSIDDIGSAVSELHVLRT